MFIGTREDGDVALSYALLQEHVYLVGYELHGHALVVVDRQQGYANQTLVSLVCLFRMNLLAHSLLLVDFVYVTCVVGKLLELLFGSSLEESVVELHDVSLRTIVGIERRRLYVVAWKLLAYVVEQSPVA